MRNLALAVFLFAPVLASAQGVERRAREPEVLILSRHLSAALTTATFNGVVLPSDRGFQVTAITLRVSGAAAGTGSTSFRVSDGTNNCDCASTCAATGVAGVGDQGVKRVACTGACAFAPSAVLSLSATAGCGTTQVTPNSIDVRGKWL